MCVLCNGFTDHSIRTQNTQRSISRIRLEWYENIKLKNVDLSCTLIKIIMIFSTESLHMLNPIDYLFKTKSLILNWTFKLDHSFCLSIVTSLLKNRRDLNRMTIWVLNT